MLDTEETVLLVAIISFLSCLWTLADKLLQKTFNMGPEDSENILSLAHAVVTLQYSDRNLKEITLEFNPNNKSTLNEELCLVFSCSYFLYDTFRWKDRGSTSKIMLCHHICSIFAIVNNLARKNWGTHGNMALLVLEGSNPLLHLRRILIGEGLKNTKICAVTEMMFFLSFIIFRLIIGFQYICHIRSIEPPLYLIAEGGVRRKRQIPQIPPVANGDLITSIFQIPIQTLGAVRDLLQTTRGRLQAAGQAYQALMAAHPNHRPNPHFVYSNSYRPTHNTNSDRYQQQNYDRYQQQNHDRYQQHNRYQQSNRHRVHNSKAIVQPRDNSLPAESRES